ncbi:MAG: hypothetical protein QOD77_870 [Thermoplasmata archaeon]|jgi:hypothetical protein|nr:hypothetical protein [Thermoplasmata archaeon]
MTRTVVPLLAGLLLMPLVSDASAHHMTGSDAAQWTDSIGARMPADDPTMLACDLLAADPLHAILGFLVDLLCLGGSVSGLRQGDVLLGLTVCESNGDAAQLGSGGRGGLCYASAGYDDAGGFCQPSGISNGKYDGYTTTTAPTFCNNADFPMGSVTAYSRSQYVTFQLTSDGTPVPMFSQVAGTDCSVTGPAESVTVDLAWLDAVNEGHISLFALEAPASGAVNTYTVSAPTSSIPSGALSCDSASPWYQTPVHHAVLPSGTYRHPSYTLAPGYTTEFDGDTCIIADGDILIGGTMTTSRPGSHLVLVSKSGNVGVTGTLASATGASGSSGAIATNGEGGGLLMLLAPAGSITLSGMTRSGDGGDGGDAATEAAAPATGGHGGQGGNLYFGAASFSGSPSTYASGAGGRGGHATLLRNLLGINSARGGDGGDGGAVVLYSASESSLLADQVDADCDNTSGSGGTETACGAGGAGGSGNGDGDPGFDGFDGADGAPPASGASGHPGTDGTPGSPASPAFGGGGGAGCPGGAGGSASAQGGRGGSGGNGGTGACGINGGAGGPGGAGNSGGAGNAATGGPGGEGLYGYPGGNGGDAIAWGGLAGHGGDGGNGAPGLLAGGAPGAGAPGGAGGAPGAATPGAPGAPGGSAGTASSGSLPPGNPGNNGGYGGIVPTCGPL